MATASGAGTGAPAWHESIRGHFQTAWNALDRAQIALRHYYDDTRDERVMSFKKEFGEAADALICVAIDELFPLTDEDLDAAEDASDDAVLSVCVISLRLHDQCRTDPRRPCRGSLVGCSPTKVADP